MTAEPQNVSTDRVACASELSALRAARLVDGEPSAAGVLGFLAWGSVIPPLTWQPTTWLSKCVNIAVPEAWSQAVRVRAAEATFRSTR